MRVERMLEDVSVARRSMTPDLEVRGVTCDSRSVRPGDLFVALRGLRADGIEFVPAALRGGAAAVAVGEGRFDEGLRKIESAGRNVPGDVGLLEVRDERQSLARLGRNVHGRPDLELRVTGITGTNGKTTTAWILAALFESAGVPCGVLGTVAYRFGDLEAPAGRTTPEGPEIHAWLRRMRDAGAGACSMEVSSHALDLGRTAGMRFSAAIFTNLTRDHLDYHRDMERYFAAKKILFDSLPEDSPAVINADDPWGRRLASGCGGRPVLYGEAADADYRLAAWRTGGDGTELTISARGVSVEIRSPLVGRPNAWNLLSAAAAAREQGISWDAIRKGAAAVASVPGRLQRIDAGQPFTVVVDYAHTDDALRNVLEVLRPLTPGRLIAVFGCGGDRDRSKRPLMGAHAARLADLVWVTSDNPRSEDPGSIIGMILEGVRGEPDAKALCHVEPDRAKAIGEAVAAARDGDTVLVAGKGHEREQIIGTRVVPFDDVEVARRAIAESLAARREGGGGDAG